MKVQIITYKSELKNRFKDYDITYSTINSPQSFDEFDVNVVSLQNYEIWRNNSANTQSINCIDDFKSLQKIIQNSSNSNTIIFFPQNSIFSYNYYPTQNRYAHHDELKNILYHLYDIINKMIPQNIANNWVLTYENTKTVINGKEYSAAFYFNTALEKNILFSKGGAKPTAICYTDRLFFSSLDLSIDDFSLKDFFTAIGIEQSEIQAPQWLVDLKCLDDEEQLEVVSENQQIILEAKNKIDVAKEKLDKNLKYKSILVTNGDELVSVVFDILEQILDCRLSDFKDNKKEDFLIKKDTLSFIGEIKGITSNVKSENVAQVERHYQAYMDELQEMGLSENVKQLLIINPFRTKDIAIRDEVHEIQINLAKRYGSLIITTEALLKIYEMFLNGETTTEKILSVLSTEIGLADINSFKQGD